VHGRASAGIGSRSELEHAVVDWQTGIQLLRRLPTVKMPDELLSQTPQNQCASVNLRVPRVSVVKDFRFRRLRTPWIPGLVENPPLERRLYRETERFSSPRVFAGADVVATGNQQRG